MRYLFFLKTRRPNVSNVDLSRPKQWLGQNAESSKQRLRYLFFLETRRPNVSNFDLSRPRQWLGQNAESIKQRLFCSSPSIVCPIFMTEFHVATFAVCICRLCFWCQFTKRKKLDQNDQIMSSEGKHMWHKFSFG